MARRRKNILLESVTSLSLLALLFSYAIPKFQQTVMDASQQIFNQTMQVSENGSGKWNLKACEMIIPIKTI